MGDEARHVAFGVLSLQEFYGQLTAAEIRERQEFAFEAAVRMRDRFLQQEVWERMGVDVGEAVKVLLQTPGRDIFQPMLFSKIVPNCRKLGLLDAADGWLRERFTDLGVIQFEHWDDTAANSRSPTGRRSGGELRLASTPCLTRSRSSSSAASVRSGATAPASRSTTGSC